MREPSATAPADADHVEALHGAIGRFVRSDSLLGSGAVVPSVLRSFRAAQQVLRTGSYVRAVRRDLQAVTAELGELAGWMLFDGLRLAQARRVNAEALLLARAAGDVQMEWFLLSNEALVCTGGGRYGEALRISRHFAEDSRVPGRVRALCRLRQARALGHAGNEFAALRAFDRARVQFCDGLSSRDPAWSWWFDERELAGHAGGLRVSLGRHSEALPLLVAAVEAARDDDFRWALYIHRAALLDAALAAGDLAEAERVSVAIVPMLERMNSARSEHRLRHAAGRGATRKLPSTLSDALEHIRRRVSAAPCARWQDVLR